MSRGVRIRLITFALLAAVGVVYVAAAYLGVVDRVLGRGVTVYAELPASGGLYVGSGVTYRGVDVGKVSAMQVTPGGVKVTLSLHDGTRIPVDAPFRVADLTAVGEQYVDFEPTTQSGPYAAEGHVFHGTAADLPETTDDILIRLHRFVRSVDGHDLSTVVKELGTMFRGRAGSLGTLIDSGSRLVRAARAHQGQTISLLESGGAVLRTQQRHEDDLRTFARGLADLTGTLRASDPQLRTILQGGRSAVREVDSLMTGLQPVLPVFIANLFTVNQVVTARLPALEQTLVTFPRVVAAGYTGTPGDGYGHLNMQFNNKTPACQQGYLPPPWPDAQITGDLPLYHARCTDARAQPGYTGSSPIQQRGVNMVPPVAGGAAYRVGTYDPRTGIADAGTGRTIRLGTQGGLVSVFGSDAWRQLLVGPLEGAEE